MKKRTILLVTSILLVALIATAGTLAYFTDKAELPVQKITTGKVDITTSGSAINLENLVPGDTISFNKENPLTVTLADNSNPAYIRVQPSITLMKGNNELTEGTVYTTVMAFINGALNVGDGGYIKLDDTKTVLLHDNITENDAPNSKKIDVISTNNANIIPITWDNEYTDISVEVTFTVEAVQAENNTTTTFPTAVKKY